MGSVEIEREQRFERETLGPKMTSELSSVSDGIVDPNRLNRYLDARWIF